MTSEQQPKWQYSIGPGPELTKEIGQIMVNYSECERSIFNLFKNVMNLSGHDAHLLVKHANMNPEKMLAVIRLELNKVKPAVLIPSIREALDLFKSSIEHRNIVAHWQWAVTDGETGLAFNDLKSKPGEQSTGRLFELGELRATAWKLAKAAILLAQANVMMFERKSSVLSHGNWAPNAYSNRGAMDEAMISQALDQVWSHIQNVEVQMQRDAQQAS